MLNPMKRLWKDESCLTMVEYGVAAAVMAIAVGVAIKALGGKLTKLFGEDSNIDEGLNAAKGG